MDLHAKDRVKILERSGMVWHPAAVLRKGELHTVLIRDAGNSRVGSWDNSAEPSEATERLTSRARVWTIVSCESEIVSRLWIIILFDKS